MLQRTTWHDTVFLGGVIFLWPYVVDAFSIISVKKEKYNIIRHINYHISYPCLENKESLLPRSPLHQKKQETGLERKWAWFKLTRPNWLGKVSYPLLVDGMTKTSRPKTAISFSDYSEVAVLSDAMGKKKLASNMLSEITNISLYYGRCFTSTQYFWSMKLTNMFPCLLAFKSQLSH